MSEHEQTQALAQATRWRIRLAELNCSTTKEFREWLSAPGNTEAWRKVQVPWEILGNHAASAELLQLRQGALAHAQKARLGRSSLHRLRYAAAAAVSAAMIVLLVAAGTLWQLYHFDVYRTKAGERRVVTLSDGSEIALDSRTELKVRYGKHARELALISGQARFNVAHDVLRPFSVAANGHQVVATGTSFNVDQLGAQTLVTLIEGHVVVLADDVPAQSSRIVLDAGEQLVLTPHVAPAVTRINVVRAIAWESGSLIFDNEPLSTVVLRIGRYGQHPIEIADERTAKLRISGVFHEGDVSGFVSTVVSYLSVKAEQQADGSVRLSSGAAGNAH